MSEPLQIFGLVAGSETQKAAIDKHCFGDCGKISMGGAVIDDHVGMLWICCQSACPYEQEVIRDYGTTESFGDDHVLHLRVLKPESTIHTKEKTT